MSRQFFNQRADAWDATVAEKDLSKLRGLVERMRLPSGATILDVGTGTGVLLPFLLEAIGLDGQIFALDFAELMLNHARRKNDGENVNFMLADVASVPVSASNFDAVVCYSSFPHFRDKARALSEMRRVMKNHGRLLICHTSSRKAINRRHRKIASVRNDLIPAEKQMRRMMAKAGFCEVSIEDNEDSYLVSATRSEL